MTKRPTTAPRARLDHLPGAVATLLPRLAPPTIGLSAAQSRGPSYGLPYHGGDRVVTRRLLLLIALAGSLSLCGCSVIGGHKSPNTQVSVFSVKEG